MKVSSLNFQTAMYNVDGPKIFSSEIVNIAGREGQIPVSFLSNIIGKHLHLLKIVPKDYSNNTFKICAWQIEIL